MQLIICDKDGCEQGGAIPPEAACIDLAVFPVEHVAGQRESMTMFNYHVECFQQLGPYMPAPGAIVQAQHRPAKYRPALQINETEMATA